MFLAGSLLLMAVAQLLLAFGGGSSPLLLQLGVGAVGVAFGAGFSMVTTLTVDCFGPANFATNYGAVDLAPSLGSYVWASRVAGGLYDSRSEPCGGAAEGVRVCWGSGCFFGAHVAAAVACVISAGLAVVLWARTTSLFGAAVPDWLIGTPCFVKEYAASAEAPLQRSSSSEAVATPVPEPEPEPEREQLRKRPPVGVADSPRSWRNTTPKKQLPKVDDDGGGFDTI